MQPRALRYLIFASPKSGTTWIQRLLSAHPEVHCSETRLFGRHVDPSRPSGLGITLESYVENMQRHFHPPTRTFNQSAITFPQELTFDLVDQIARTTLRVAGKSIYGEKQTPYLGTASQVLRQLSQYDRDTRLIFLVRDGRDVAVSGAAQWNNLTRSKGADPTGTRQQPPISTGIDERYFDMFMSHWTEAAAAFDEYGHAFPHRLVMRYEDMLTNPIEEATRLLAFIGADSAADIVQTCLHAASFERLSGGRSRGEEDAASFFRKGIAGDWRNSLSTDQISRFEHIAGRWLRAYAYETAASSFAELKPLNTPVPSTM